MDNTVYFETNELFSEGVSWETGSSVKTLVLAKKNSEPNSRGCYIGRNHN